MPPRAPLALAAAAALVAVAASARTHDLRDDFAYTLTDAQYYSMPQLFALEDWAGCAGRGQVYCVGSFELSAAQPSALLRMMQRYSANWVERFNHTRLHRGVCLPASCPRLAPLEPPGNLSDSSLHSWFESCVNESTMSTYNLSARLYTVESCSAGGGRDAAGAPAPGARALAAVTALLLALAVLSSAVDLTLSDTTKKGYQWALAWSLPGCWRELTAAPPASSTGGPDLRAFDGLRVLCMMCVIVEHVCWLATLAYGADPRFIELNRYKTEVMLLTNSTLVVQVFFMMSSFLLARKLLRRGAAGGLRGGLREFGSMMVERIVRVSPAYWAVVWLMASGWAALGAGPQWPALVETEAAICRKKWWTHLLYLNNVIYPDEKCLIQTWYLAADMQLYALSLALTLALARWRRLALPLLAALLAGSVALLAALAYVWRLVPTFIMHRPECIRASYSGEWSFNVLYQSPLGNVPGALAGLLLAELDQRLRARRFMPQNHKWFRWTSVAACPLAFWWVAWSPWLVARGPPNRAAAAALAALERPIFAAIVGLAVLGAMQGVESPWQRLLAWRGWRVFSRLSFCALLLHLPLNKSLLAARLAPAQMDHAAVILEWLGVAGSAYLLALPLALLLELPCLRLHRALSAPPAAARAPAASTAPAPSKADHM